MTNDLKYSIQCEMDKMSAESAHQKNEFGGITSSVFAKPLHFYWFHSSRNVLAGTSRLCSDLQHGVGIKITTDVILGRPHAVNFSIDLHLDNL